MLVMTVLAEVLAVVSDEDQHRVVGPGTALPHGSREPHPLEENDVVLMDSVCRVEGYCSDISRTIVYGEPTARHSENAPVLHGQDRSNRLEGARSPEHVTEEGLGRHQR